MGISVRKPNRKFLLLDGAGKDFRRVRLTNIMYENISNTAILH